MKKYCAAIAASVAMLGISSTAIGQGPATILAVQPAQPPGSVNAGCAFFELSGGASGAWYALNVTDSSFSSQFGIVMSAFYSGTPVTFSTAGTACGYPKVGWMYIGTPN